MQERIAKIIAQSGICSRREAERLISSGKVKVNDTLITTPATLVSQEDMIYVNSKLINCNKEDIRIWKYYKPVGLITSRYDPHNPNTIFSQLGDIKSRVISVGRLDLNSEGLLLLTNNGMLSRALELPKNKVKRVYKVRAYGDFKSLKHLFDKINFSIEIDNQKYSIYYIKLLSNYSTNSWFEVALFEGKNREIRKIFQKYDMLVNKLIRVSYGTFTLDELTPGSYLEASKNEISKLIKLYNLDYIN